MKSENDRKKNQQIFDCIVRCTYRGDRASHTKKTDYMAEMKEERKRKREKENQLHRTMMEMHSLYNGLL